MKPRLVYLEWADAVANANWFSADDAEKWASETEWLVREAGWLIAETKEYVVFASAWKIEDVNTHEQFANLHKIPKTWIRSRQDLAVRKRK